MTHERIAYSFAPLSGDDRWALERFVRKVDSLNASTFAHTKTGLRAQAIPGVSYLGGPAWRMGITGPSEEEIKAVIGDFRQLYTATNRASAARVLNILKCSAHARGTDTSRKMIASLKALGATLRHRAKHDPRGMLLEEDSLGVSAERSPSDIIDTWFNGEYFHDDPELARQLAEDDNPAVDMMRMSLQMAIRDYLAYWTALRNLAVEVLKHPELSAA